MYINEIGFWVEFLKVVACFLLSAGVVYTLNQLSNKQ